MGARFIVVNARAFEVGQSRVRHNPRNARGFQLLDRYENLRLPELFSNRLEAQTECDKKPPMDSAPQEIE